MIFRVYVNFKDGILDPEAEAIKQTIANMGLKSVKNLVKGKFFDIEVKKYCYKSLFCISALP